MSAGEQGELPPASVSMRELVKNAAIWALVALGLCFPLIAFRTDQGFSHQTVLEARPFLVAIFVIAVFAGRLLWRLYMHPVQRARRVLFPPLDLSHHQKAWLPRAGLAALLIFPWLALTLTGQAGAIKWIDNFGVQILIYVMLAWGLNIVVGLAGLLDLGYVAFYAVGAYTYAIIATYVLPATVPWLGPCPTNPFGTGNCNGLFGSSFALMQSGLIEALTKADPTVDFGAFDNDGPDNVPNSGDDDGVVDAVLFLHASMDGACLTATNNHLWSHRSALFYQTNDSAHNGGKIVAQDYILQSGLGSPSGGVCDSTAIAPIGTAAHEWGHLLALPDLYDTQGPTEGIGEWGIMGSGNYSKPLSPTRYDAWSLQQMGWATIVPLTIGATYSVGPEPTADTVFFVNVQGVQSATRTLPDREPASGAVRQCRDSPAWWWRAHDLAHRR